ncbi:HAMP domain-containing histidine kinase [Bacillus infantis]|uniref:HAMP domain-containing sensor histidine kinase n=1 Tax=Bacillus infantis TaxID=324767 RepID=UPI001CD1D063|nr:HAMP domain-containing sensor histidine kinase [Bacillus infantis]MCA1038554.1 HAMP domain-containing histidine kinase [Bacillus infantis]
MKLKLWLMAAFLAVMILPLIVLLLLFSFIQSYDEKQEMLDYLEAQKKLELYERLLSNPNLYDGTGGSEYERLREYAQEKTIFTLFDDKGKIVFSTDPKRQLHFKEELDNVYKGLYEMETGYDAFILKKPVFSNGETIGFFEVSFLRLSWIEGVEERTAWGFFIYFILFACIYAGMLVLLKRKLFMPMNMLMERMNSFARGEKPAELPGRKDEIGELFLNFQNMAKKLKEKEEEIRLIQQQKDFMAASISHDLKTPLTSIMVSAESAMVSKAGSAKDKLELILRKSQYIRQLIDDLTTMMSLQSVNYLQDAVEVEGQEFFEMALSEYEELAGSHKLTLTDYVNVSGRYNVNPKQMLRFFDNLVMNAIQHTEAGGSVHASAFSLGSRLPEFLYPKAILKIRQSGNQDKGVWLVIQNEGSWIPEQDYERVFQPFYQGDPSRKKHTRQGERGSGLGLPIAKMILEKQGGKIDVVSEEGFGTCFIGFLPESASRERKAAG